MVSNIPRYNKQIHFCLSTDDPNDLELHNGDQFFLMDVDKLVMYDEASVSFKEISLAGGGGGGGGGTPVYGLIHEINITTPVNAISYTLPELVVNDGKLWAEYENITMSEADYLYVAVVAPAETATQVSGYFANTDTIVSGYSQHTFVSAKTIAGHTYQGMSAAYVPTNNKIDAKHKAGWDLTKYAAKPYGGKSITGGTIRLYGRIS